MIYLLEFIKGILMSAGIIIGFFLFAYFLVKGVSKNINPDEDYDPEDLIVPFEKYLKKCKDEENYEEIPKVEAVIANLRNGSLDGIEAFKISKDYSVHVKDDDNNTSLRMVKDYLVVKMIVNS